jgi:hypothetical protein
MNDTCTAGLRKRDIKQLTHRLRKLAAKMDKTLVDAKLCPVCRVKLLSDLVVFAARRDGVHPKATVAALLSGVSLYYPGARIELTEGSLPSDKVH